MASYNIKVITPNDFKGTDSERIEKAIDAAVKAGSYRIHVPAYNEARKDNIWLIDRAIILPSDFSLILDGATIELAPGVQDNIVRNAAAGVKGAKPDKNVEVIGIGHAKATLSGGKCCHFDVPGDKSGWRTIGILFQNVEGFVIDNVTMHETQAWAISVENGCSNGRIANINFENSNSIPNQDGIDIRKGCHDIVIEDIFGYVGDDAVALTGLMREEELPYGKGMQIGGNTPTGDDDIYNITIRDVYVKCVGGHGIIRLLNHDGVKLHDVKIENVWNTALPTDKQVYSCIRIGDENYSSIRKAYPEELYNIDIDGLYWSGMSGIRYSKGHGRIDAKNVVNIDDLTFEPKLIPQPKKMELTGSCFIAPGAYVKRDWITFKRKASIAKEGYKLSVTRGGITVWASDEAGEFYAMQTIRQLASEQLPYRNNDTYAGGDCGHPLCVPCCEIEDAPAFRWRGLHLDECRHFFGKETVKGILDQMANHKFNTFHWHLTEDQGWRIAIDKYPLLEKYASVRACSPKRFPTASDDFNTDVYGPYIYSKDDIREIVAYAAERHITIVPEIELPGHARAALAAYPELSCVGKKLPRTPFTKWGIEDDVFCVGNDAAIKFLEDVIDEVCELFPGEFFHFGGDECPTVRWRTCPKCQARAKELGLDVEKLQGWVTKHFTEYLAKKGKRAIGWDEILECEIPQDAAVMSWRSTEGAIKGANKGHEVVLTPVQTLYFNRSQGIEEDPFQGRILTPIPLENVYNYDPLAGIPKKQHKYVLGAQCCLWSEVIISYADLDWKLWPRGCALAEILWTNPKERNFEEFCERLVPHRKWMISHGVNVAPLK